MKAVGTQLGDSPADRSAGSLLLGAGELADLLAIGKSTLWRLHASGRIPLPVRLGGATRWHRKEIERWLEAGAPPRAKWESMKSSLAGGRKRIDGKNT